MKRLFCLLLTVILSVGLLACGKTNPPVNPIPVPTVSPTKAAADATQATPTTESTAAETEPIPTETAPPASTAPAHSPYYLPEVSFEDMVTYFNEVVLDTEYSTGDGDSTLVQKWTEPIRCRIYGDPTDEDLSILENLFDQLNEIAGFPGIQLVTESENVNIRFLDEATFYSEFSDFLGGDYADAAVQYWYSDQNVIYSGRIGYRTDVSQELRYSILLEEIINLLGITDTTEREDSIVYQYSNDVTQLSEIDWVLVGLLYHPDIQCGMNAEQCRQVLETLYY